MSNPPRTAASPAHRRQSREIPTQGPVVGWCGAVRGALTLRKLHRLSAWPIALYALVHIANHLAGLRSVESHLAFMEAARVLYRSPAVEAVLLLAVGLQVYTGSIFIVRNWTGRRGIISWLQAGSGAYLAFFLLIHVGAVLFGRAVLHLDTNFYFAAAGFCVPPFQFCFAPYYFLGVSALFMHLGCALYWRLRTKSALARILALVIPNAIGWTISLLIVLSLFGAFYRVMVPEKYKSTYGWHR